ncbi:MAG: hypothetical protein E6713_17505 [Sporomusaceae bacterium]|nr:hypothetical protein [Sporomusaceae bacterium]
MKDFKHPLYPFWNGKNLGNNDEFSDFAKQVLAESTPEAPCEISSETTPADETE